MIRVLLVDDFPAVRTGLRHLIDSFADVDVAGEAATGEAAVDLAQSLAPDVILMDLSLPGIGGIEATRRIVGANPDAVVLVLTAHDDRRRTVDAIVAGAVGYVLKDIEPLSLIEAIRAAKRGESPLDPRAARALVDATCQKSNGPVLSNREREVVELVAAGLANKQIARRLAISEKTVKNHLTKIFSLLGVSGRTQAAIRAIEHGLIDPR